MKIQGYLIVLFLFVGMPSWAQTLNDARCTYENCCMVIQGDEEPLKRIIKTSTSKNKSILHLAGTRSFGFGTSSSQISIPFLYDDAQAFCGGYAIVTLDGKQGMIDSTGRVVIPIMYKGLSNVSEGMVFYSIHGDTVNGILDLNGNEYLLDPQMGVVQTKIGEHSNLTFVADSVHLTYKSGLIIPYSFSEGLAVINNKVMNKEGNYLFSSPYTIYDCKEGMMRIKQKISKNSFLYGFMDSKGNVVVEPIYSLAQDFSRGRSVVCSGKLSNPIVKVIDKTGMVQGTFVKE